MPQARETPQGERPGEGGWSEEAAGFCDAVLLKEVQSFWEAEGDD